MINQAVIYRTRKQKLLSFQCTRRDWNNLGFADLNETETEIAKLNLRQFF